MRSLLDLVRTRGNIAVVVAGALMIGYICLLVGVNYFSQVELQESALEQLRQDMGRRASAVNYFCSERKNDLKNLAKNRALSAFFENKALGMSMEYGLRSSLLGISETFNRLLANRRLGKERIYPRIVFIDISGRLLVDSQPEKEKGAHDLDWKTFLAPEKLGAAIIDVHDGRWSKVMVSIPYFFKNRYAGQILAWISPQSFYHLVKEAKGSSMRCVYVVCKKHLLPLSADMQNEPGLSTLTDLGTEKIAKIFRFEQVKKDGSRVDMIGIGVPVKDSPLSLVTLLPASEVLGHMTPWHLPLAMGALAIIILGGMAFAFRVNTQKLILDARLEEASKREQEVEEKNRQLGREISIRERAEESLRKAHDELEVRVEERTKELAESNVLLKREIEERKRAEEALRESEMQKQAILDGIKMNIAFVNENLEMLWVNKTAADSVGKSPEEMIGHKCHEFWADPEKPCDGCPTVKAFKMMRPEHTIMFTPDGRIWEESGEPVFNQDGKLIGVVEIAQDITETKKLEAQLRQAQKMEAIGTLAGGIAHDFNNILAAIIGYADVAGFQVDEDSKAKDSLKEVIKAGHRAKNLIRQILAFSRQSEQERMPMQMRSIVNESIKLLRASLPTTIEIRQNIENDIGAIEADPTQMQQIIMNLCTNAHHAMSEEGGVLEVNLSEIDLDSHATSQYPDLSPGKYIRLTVSDTGLGMDKEVVERIFEPYFTTKEKGRGTGLGLSVVHGIVKSHEGAITAYSEPGKGSTFHVYIPAIQREVVEEKDEIEPLPTGHERILFIDDEPALVDIGKEMLEHLGYKVDTRTSSIEALELFKAQPDRFDLVITDTTMPNMTGDKLARELMQIRPDIPIIICTGFSERMTEEKAKGMGIRAFAMKPLVMRDLANSVRKALDT